MTIFGPGRHAMLGGAKIEYFFCKIINYFSIMYKDVLNIFKRCGAGHIDKRHATRVFFACCPCDQN